MCHDDGALRRPRDAGRVRDATRCSAGRCSAGRICNGIRSIHRPGSASRSPLTCTCMFSCFADASCGRQQQQHRRTVVPRRACDRPYDPLRHLGRVQLHLETLQGTCPHHVQVFLAPQHTPALIRARVASRRRCGRTRAARRLRWRRRRSMAIKLVSDKSADASLNEYTQRMAAMAAFGTQGELKLLSHVLHAQPPQQQPKS